MIDAHALFDLSGQVAVVTGSSRGIGRAIAEALASAGAKVVISSRKLDKCEDVAEAIKQAGGEAIAVACNISHKDQLRALVDKSLETWGRIDTLVCNAAVNPYYGPLLDIEDGAYDKIMNTNVRSNLWLCSMVIPGMAERGGGSVIIVSSIAAFIGSRRLGAYGLSKAADMALARNLAAEWGEANVRANCINPAIVRTHFARALWEDKNVYDKAIQAYALKRIGEPEEIAGAALFLAARASSFMTGQTLVIDGGALLHADEV
jgi:NAD(P)-dependent dehydrogenase (short-subunit alcohol dehydrogenase family)